MNENKLKIGISIGDINGIGLEVILKTLTDKRILQSCTPVLYGSTKVISYHKNIIKVKDLLLHNAKDVHHLNPNAVNIINCWIENVKITLGKCSAEGGKYALFSLEQAVEDLEKGHIDALVTAPINKKAMQLNGFEYPGHTEYLTDKLGAKENLMLMVHESLRVGLVTNHLPIAKVAETITEELVLNKIKLMNETLKMDFGINRPVIGVLGLNPHAGDGGVLGSEDKEIIFPAIEKAKEQGILAIGPYAADGFFGSGNYKNFDGILAMYHDQGLVTFKALSFGNGVNFTAGLSAIRTSPDHGTGFEIAGKNAANPQSFREALYLAIDAANQRKDYLEYTENPLNVAVNYEATEDEILSEDGAPVKSNTGKSNQKSHYNKKGQHPHHNKGERSNNKKQYPKKGKEQRQGKQNLTVEERLALAEKRKKGQGKSNLDETTPQKADSTLTIEEPVKKQEAKQDNIQNTNITEALEPIPNLAEKKQTPPPANTQNEEKQGEEEIVTDNN